MTLVTRATLASLLLVALEAALASPGASLPGPTFDCAKARGGVENLICRDAQLTALDRRMYEVYGAAMKSWPADVAAKERALQRGWLKGRNECWKADDKRGCIEESYRTRIVELQIRSGQLLVPSPIAYACAADEDKPLYATFYNKTDPPSVVLTYGDDQVIAFLLPSASGARYGAANMEFWEHQGEASVNWYGTSMTCRQAATQPGAPQRTALSGTSWKLVQFQSMDDTRLEPEPDATYTLAFDGDGRLRVHADCNRGQGSWYSPDNVTLQIGPLAMTRAYCQSKLYDRFVRDLNDISSYIVRDGKLYLSLRADAGIYEFSALP